MHWRCMVTSVSNISRLNGALYCSYDEELCAVYSSAQDNEYFGWTDRKTATARQLADTFVERFGPIADTGRGEDWIYAGCYVQMLGLAEAGYFPVAYGDYLESDYFELVALGAPEPPPHLPAPPPGECDQSLD
jgi:hypothetical protein